ncbi:MAG: LacI family DNA-binding transcriptional regulator [Lachnospiraceae bacterium]|nr:LacI family DNA-binding transcriptional regulator [Lachnospiraceae bacterium]
MGATIKDIAAKTGLGLATISKYLNGGHVLEKNQAAIEKAIAELDFQVNEFARSLKTRQSKTVGVVIPQLNNLFMTSIVTKVEETLRHHGYGVIVCDTSKQPEREAEVLQFLLNKMVDGVILLATSKEAEGLDPVLKRNIPVVLIDRKVDRLEEKTDMVLLDNFRAAYESTRYLLERGHRRIGLLIGSEDVYTSRERLLGYYAAMDKAGISVPKNWIRCTDFTMQGAYQQTLELMEEESGLTAIFATNFEMTLGTVLALKDKGCQVPGEVSIIGFDNRELARAMQPALTIVSQPVEEMGVEAANLLLRRMQPSDGAAEEAQTILLRAAIEEGASVKRVAD